MPLNTKENIVTIGLIATLIVGIVLRFKGLTFQSYWIDELFSINASMPERNFWSMLDITVKDVHPPLYQSLLWAWYHIFGFNEYAGRLLSAIIGSLGIFAVYLLGKTLFNKEVGLYAAAIASMNQFLIYFSQETRSNGLLFLLSTVSYIYFLKVLTDYSKKNFLLYLFYTILLAYTHYFGFFLIATQVFVFILFIIKEKDKRKLLATLAVVATAAITISLLPLLANVLRLEGQESYWMPMPSRWFALDYMKEYVKSQYLEGIFLLTLSFSLIYLFKKTENKKYKTMTIVLLLWIIIGYLLPYIRSITALPLLVARSTIIVIPALILLVSYGIYLLKDTTLKMASIGVITFFSIYQLNYADYYGKAAKEQWRDILQTIKHSGADMPIYAFYYDNYSAYNKMLSLDLDMHSSVSIAKELKNNSLSNCFFVIDAHRDHISKEKALQDKKITKVLEIKKNGAKGILYAYNTMPQTCLSLYNGIIINTDFSKCNLSKPYKGNPLGMWWNGSVTTPIYSLTKNSYNLIVNAKGTKAFDEFAKLKIQVFKPGGGTNSILAEKTVDTKQNFTDFSLPFEIKEDENISFVFSFINDKGREKPKEDRNIYLKSIILKNSNYSKYYQYPQ